MNTATYQNSLLQTEHKLIYLMLNHRDAVEELIESKITSEFFCPDNSVLVKYIFEEYVSSNKKRLLTRSHYVEILKHLYSLDNSFNLATSMDVYDLCNLGVSAHINDLGMLKQQLVDAHINSCSLKLLEKFATDKKKHGSTYAAVQLKDSFSALLSMTSKGESKLITLEDIKDGYVAHLNALRKNPEEAIKCYIPEIDDPINVGLKPGHLTLFAGDVGSHKCVAMGEKILLHDGSEKRIENLYHDFCENNIYHENRDVCLLSLNEQTDEFIKQTVSSVTVNGVKRCRRITTTLGFSCVVTLNHPILTSVGYVYCDKITEDHEIAVYYNKIKHFDKIHSIVDVGDMLTYDISMPQVHNFIVGGIITHNTNMMLNMALNVYDKQKKSVLFVALEMSAYDLMNRIISNRTGIEFTKLAKPELLSDDDFKTILDCQIWCQGTDNRFAILDASDRTTVAQLKYEIEKHAVYVQPKVIVIDYIALMGMNTELRNDLAIGEVLKDLRMLGRKYGFHIVSAAQIGRSALAKIKQEGFDAARPDSTALRGSHEYAADSDTIFALSVSLDEENKLKIYTIKARHGKSGQAKELILDASRCRINSVSDILLGDKDYSIDIDLELNKPASDIEKEHKEIKWDIDLDHLNSVNSDPLAKIGD